MTRFKPSSSKVFSMALATAIAWAALAPAAHADTYAEAAAATLKAHPVMQASLAELKVATESVNVAKSGYYPQLSVSSEFNSDTYTRAVGSVGLFGREAGVTAQQLVYDGSMTPNRIVGADAEKDAQTADRQGDQNQLLLAVARVYIGVMRDREQVAAARANLAYHRDSVSRLQRMVKSDPGKGFDLTQVRARESLALSNLVEREAALSTSEAAYREIVGHVPNTLQVPTPPEAPALRSLNEALRVGQAENPTVKAASDRARVRLAARDEARGGLSPRVDALARYVKGTDRQSLAGQNDEAYAGLRASYAFPTGLATVAQARGADLSAQSASLKVDAAKRDVREAVRVAWAQRDGLEATLPLATEHWKRVKSVLEGFKKQYALGRRSMLELLIVQEEVYNAESRKIQLSYDRMLADFAVAAQTGSLVALYAVPDDTPSGPVLHIGETHPAPQPADQLSRD